jgi:hypothetical protein
MPAVATEPLPFWNLAVAVWTAHNHTLLEQDAILPYASLGSGV